MENKRGGGLKQSKAGVAEIKLQKTRRRVCALGKKRILEERTESSVREEPRLPSVEICAKQPGFQQVLRREQGSGGSFKPPTH